MPAEPSQLRTFAAKVRRWAAASADLVTRSDMENFAAELEDIAKRREQGEDSGDGQSSARQDRV